MKPGLDPNTLGEDGERRGEGFFLQAVYVVSQEQATRKRGQGRRMETRTKSVSRLISVFDFVCVFVLLTLMR